MLNSSQFEVGDILSLHFFSRCGEFHEFFGKENTLQFETTSENIHFTPFHEKQQIDYGVKYVYFLNRLHKLLKYMYLQNIIMIFINKQRVLIIIIIILIPEKNT